MSLPRAVQVPAVIMPRDPETVCIQTILVPEIRISGHELLSEYLESNLTPDEAETLAFNLWKDARRARYHAAINARIAARKAEP